MSERVLCPKCKGEYSIRIQRMSRVDDQGQWPAVEDLGHLVKCADCGEVRHCTHWKTPAEYEQQERDIDAVWAEVNASGPFVLKPRDAR